MTFFDEVEKNFGSKSFYEVLGITKEADSKQIKKAYYKLSLQCHPDRASSENKENNTIKFQILTKIHSVLSNTEQRAVYDETGELLDESDICTQDRDWESYWRLLFKKISKADIDTFHNEYKDSEKEKEDIKKCYLESEGDLDQIIENVLCASYEDEERFKSIIQKCIDTDELPSLEKFTNENTSKRNKRKKKAGKEAKEAEEHAKEIGLSADGDLKSLILQRQGNREKEMNGFFNDLEAKYCKPKAKKASKKGASATTNSKSTKRKRK